MRNIVLMVDDDCDLREIFSALLSATTLKVHTFASPKDAQTFLINPENRTKVCAIVSDLMMSPVDGIEFLSYIKNNPETAELDFFLFTDTNAPVLKPFISPFKLNVDIEKPPKDGSLNAINGSIGLPAQRWI